MKGYKTYTGIIISLLGFVGVAQMFDTTELTKFIDSLLNLIGLAIAMYGRYMANK